MSDPNDPREKICPFIFMARIMNPRKPRNVEPSAFSCMGARCALWVHALDGQDLTWKDGCALEVMGTKAMERS